MNQSIHSDKSQPGAGHGAAGRQDPEGEGCTRDHVHDASCEFGRKPVSEHQDKSPHADEDSQYGTVRDPYQTGESHDLPSTSKDSDSDGWHRTTDRTDHR